MGRQEPCDWCPRPACCRPAVMLDLRYVSENLGDVKAALARRGFADTALLDRLELTPARFAAMASGLREVAALPDPVGAISELNYRPSGIQVGQMRVPLGDAIHH